MLYMFYESLTPSMVKEFFYPDFSIIFLFSLNRRSGMWYMIYGTRVETPFGSSFRHQSTLSMYVTHLFDLIYPQKARYKYIKNFLNESFHMSVFLYISIRAFACVYGRAVYNEINSRVVVAT